MMFYGGSSTTRKNTSEMLGLYLGHVQLSTIFIPADLNSSFRATLAFWSSNQAYVFMQPRMRNLRLRYARSLFL